MRTPLSIDHVSAALSQGAPKINTGSGAAVAAVLRPRPEGIEVLFIRRAEFPGDPWSGHMAMPGGRLEDQDATLQKTAIRETREELGLDLEVSAHCLGQLDDIPTHLGTLSVRPFVYALETEAPLHPNEEVAGIYWVTLRSLMSGERDTQYPFEWKGQPISLPGYQVEDQVVWGLTYKILQVFFQKLD